MTVYELLVTPDQLFEDGCELVEKGIVSNYDYGRLIMYFYKNNDHVKLPVFMLNNDVMGMVYVSDDGQMLAVSYNEDNMQTLETEIFMNGLVRRDCYPAARYEFKEPVLYDFIRSGYPDFEDFLETIREDE